MRKATKEDLNNINSYYGVQFDESHDLHVFDDPFEAALFAFEGQSKELVALLKVLTKADVEGENLLSAVIDAASKIHEVKSGLYFVSRQ